MSPESIELDFKEVERLVSESTFVIDILALQDKQKNLINGGYNFLSTIIHWTLGKVFFVSSIDQQSDQIMDWINKWRISSNPFFMREQVWGKEKSPLNLINGLGASDNKLVLVTGSNNFVDNISSARMKIMRVDKEAQGFSYHKQWMNFHDPDFWNQ